MGETCGFGTACVEADRAIAFTLGDLPDAERAEIEARIDRCPRCRRVIAEAARTAATQRAGRPVGARDTLARIDEGPVAGDRVDRYVLERRLGSGGMGVVHLAHDPELRRPVVIKLVRPDFASGEDSDAFDARLAREAQAMALLSHPNVVQIFDIGRHGDRIFFAMEFVDGQTLDAWLAEQPRDAGAILAVLRQVGAGLDAAHRAGLVHRDVKPSNILVDRDGVAKITDFGLARSAGATSRSLGARSSGVHAALTDGGAAIGTPAYMSPEQAAGAAVDARSDQYAFALTALDALLGQSPRERRVEPTAPIDDALAKIGLRPRVREALGRALEADPAARFGSLAELLRELEPPRRRRRWTWLAVAGAACAITGASAWVASGSSGSASCELATDAVARAIAPTTRTRLDATVREGRSPQAAAGFATLVAARLDAAVAAWSEAYARSCPRTACLEAQLDELAMMLDDAIEDHFEELSDVPVAIAKWTDALGTCASGPTGTRDYRHQLARALAYWRQDRPELARRAADAAVALATDPETTIRAKLRRIDTNDPTPTDLAALPELYAAAMRTGDAALVGAVALTGASACLGGSGCAEEWTNRLADVLARVPATSALRSDLAGLRGELAIESGKPAVAVAMFEDEIRQVTARGGDRSFDLIPGLGGLVRAHAELRQPDQALVAAGRADEIAIWWLGADHPYRANTLRDLGIARIRGHDPRRAVDAFNRAIALRAEVEGVDSPRLSDLYNMLAVAYQQLGLPGQALAVVDLAIAANAKLRVPALRTRLDLVRNGAVLASSVGRPDARKRIDDAFALAPSALAADHPQWTTLYETRGLIELRARELVAASEDLRRALASYERMGEVAEVAQIQATASLATAALLGGDLAGAQRLVARAHQLAERRGAISRVAAGLVGAELALATGDARAARSELASVAPALSDPLLVPKPRELAHYHQLASAVAERTGDAAAAAHERDLATELLRAAEIDEDAGHRDCIACARR